MIKGNSIPCEEKKVSPVLFSTKETCCGCSACYSSCPVDAIKMKTDDEGFLYPVIDEKKCVKCYKCISACAFKYDLHKKKNSSMEPLVYGVKAKRKEILNNSSSGGAFTVLSDFFLINGDAIACSLYNYQDNHLEYELIKTEKKRNDARGSKYIQSIPGNIFHDIEKWIKENPSKSLLFVGMGCQAAAFAKYATEKSIRDKVTIVDIICHGNPSPLIWEKYLNYITHGIDTISFLTFKDKRNGWMGPTALVCIDGKEISIKDYVNLFYSCNIMRPSCHVCPYASIHRNTDITIGDFWGIDKVNPDFFDSMGVSLLLIHSLKGKDLFEKVMPNLEWFESNTKDCIQANLVQPTLANVKRDKFWKDYQQYGIEHVIKKYGRKSILEKICKKVKTLIK